MARTPKDWAIATREARARLPARKQPYWKQVVPGLFVGYAKQRRVNSWVTKRFVAGKYIWERLGSADDVMASDGKVVLTYTQAVKAAQDLALGLRVSRPRYHGDGVTVDAALDAYFVYRRQVNPTSHATGSDELAAARHIRPVFGKRLVASLGMRELENWQSALAITLPTVRGRRVSERIDRSVDLNDPVVKRQRRNSANRVWAVLRAALTLAWRDPNNGIASNDGWLRIKPLKVDSIGPPRMLDSHQIQGFLECCDADFRQIVEAAFLTGARYGEIVRLRVRDYDAVEKIVRIHQNKTGRTLRQPLPPDGPAFFSRAVAGKALDDLIFRRADGEPWGKSHQARPMREAADRAGLRDVSFKVTRATYGKMLLLVSHDIELVAKALGHSNSRITAKHYVQYLTNEVELALQKMPSLSLAYPAT